MTKNISYMLVSGVCINNSFNWTLLDYYHTFKKVHINITELMDFKTKKDPIPGYTGCLPQKEENLSEFQQISTNGQIPGYVGYIPSIKPENLYGKTYGKITENCYNGRFNQGI
jgi:hypothetical protein